MRSAIAVTVSGPSVTDPLTSLASSLVPAARRAFSVAMNQCASRWKRGHQKARSAGAARTV